MTNFNKAKDRINDIDPIFLAKNPGKQAAKVCPYCGLSNGTHKSNCSYMNKYLN